MDKKLLKDPKMHMFHCQNFISIETAVQKLGGGGGGGVLLTLFGQGVGQKHLGRVRVKCMF